uniref:NitT/TauT family transport system ATP-binding protein n=1 Tax=Candidatus Kentrum sp. TC TaxID=2126339 RepID=A0A450YQM1_9GAMM|nr:MAG: NitT/TauT family transport system ATP-binding protein [Candidatus Kentron sp. TC]
MAGTNPNVEAIRFDAVHRYFRKDGGELRILDGFDLAIEAGQFTVILGPSGCGKSTLLQLAAGLDFSNAGTIRVFGTEVTGPQRDCGMVFQQYTSFPWLTVRENVQFGLSHHELHQHRDWVNHLLEVTGLTGFSSALPHTLSGGMQQRLAIARTLAVYPKILLMDEPFGALDVQTRRSMQSLLLDIWQESKPTILFVTHDIEEGLFLGERVIVVSKAPARMLFDQNTAYPYPRVEDLRYSNRFKEQEKQLSQLLGK